MFVHLIELLKKQRLLWESQHDRTQTWISHFDCVGSNGGCDMVKKDKYMGFKIGQHICHVSLKKPRNIRQMMFNKDGELLLGTGTHTTGWLFAKDCVRTSQLPKVIKVPA